MFSASGTHSSGQADRVCLYSAKLDSTKLELTKAFRTNNPSGQVKIAAKESKRLLQHEFKAVKQKQSVVVPCDIYNCFYMMYLACSFPLLFLSQQKVEHSSYPVEGFDFDYLVFEQGLKILNAKVEAWIKRCC